jgi:hypothetical protein
MDVRRGAEETDMWEGVRDRVLALRRTRPGKVFGASGHQFRLAEPLGGADLAEVEAQFGVALPSDYRAFLGTVSAGGAGPYYGLALLARDGAAGWNWHGDVADPAEPWRTARPFGGKAGVAEALARLDVHDAAEPKRADFDDTGYDAAHAAWMGEEDALLARLVPPPGVITISHQGCGYTDWLVVAGPDRGGVWTDAHGDGTGLHLRPKLAADGQRLSFLTWYMTWLEAAEAAARAWRR